MSCFLWIERGNSCVFAHVGVDVPFCHCRYWKATVATSIQISTSWGTIDTIHLQSLHVCACACVVMVGLCVCVYGGVHFSVHSSPSLTYFHGLEVSVERCSALSALFTDHGLFTMKPRAIPEEMWTQDVLSLVRASFN